MAPPATIASQRRSPIIGPKQPGLGADQPEEDYPTTMAPNQRAGETGSTLTLLPISSDDRGSEGLTRARVPCDALDSTSAKVIMHRLNQ